MMRFMLIKKNRVYIFSLCLSFISLFLLYTFCNIFSVKILHHKTLRILQMWNAFSLFLKNLRTADFSDQSDFLVFYVVH